MPVPLAPAVRDNHFAQSVVTPLPGRYDRLAEILSMGQNARWRRTMIDKIMPADDGTVLDVASGTAGVALQVTGRSKARVVGVDLTEQMLRQGQRNVAASAQRDRIALTIGRGEQLPFADASFYAAGPGGWRDWWTLLHPPYTAWHLAYVVIGACLAPRVSLSALVATLIAFFLAVGLAAHALDELNGRPLQTRISSPALIAVTAVGLTGAVTLGAAGIARIGWALLPFMIAGPVLVVAYNAELLHGALHTDMGFAAAWGAFPVLTAYAAQTGRLAIAPVLAAAAALALSAAQRGLSTPARTLRRRIARVQGSITLADGQVTAIDQAVLLAPLEQALRAMSWAIVLFAAALAVARLG